MKSRQIKSALINFLLIILSKDSIGQDNSRFIRYEIPWEKIQHDSLGHFHYKLQHDSTKIIFIDPHNLEFLIYDSVFHYILSEGGFFRELDFFSRHGKVTEYYTDGKIESVGYYYRDQPIGLWKYYYPNGQLSKAYSITYVNDSAAQGKNGFCKVGLYEEYYDNGNLKMSGCYQGGFDTGFYKSPIAEPPWEEYVKVLVPVSKKFGRWVYYKQNGEIEKTEENY
jgi:hypothetical protein